MMEDNSEEKVDGLDTLRGAFIKVVKIKKTQLDEEWTFIKLSEIKSIAMDERFSNVDGSKIKTYKDTSYFCFLSAEELLKIINLFIFKQDDYFEMYGS